MHLTGSLVTYSRANLISIEKRGEGFKQSIKTLVSVELAVRLVVGLRDASVMR